MAQQYRKKKRVAGPSKNEEKVQRSREAEAMLGRGNSLSARYPNVRGVTVKLAFSGEQGQSFGDETRSYGPNDPCDFAVPCPGRCGVGSFDLAGKIDAMIEAHEPESKSSGVCQQQLFAGQNCNCKLECAVQISYL